MTDAAVAEVQTSLRGIVEIVFYSGVTFSAGKLRTPDGDLATFAGKIFVREASPSGWKDTGPNIRSMAGSLPRRTLAMTWRWTRMAWPTSWRTIRM